MTETAVPARPTAVVAATTTWEEFPALWSKLLDEVWDPHWYGPTRTIDVHVASIRKKLGDPRWVETVRGVGFRLGLVE